MKVRLLAVMAVVVVGVMAGTSPAMAKKAHTASAWSNQHKDNKAFGEAIHNLRLASDKTNWDASQFSSLVLTAATALQKGLTDLAASYTNFEYGVVQLGTKSGSTFTPLAGSFLATPRIDPTVEQSTVHGQFPISAPTASTLAGTVAVRSVDPTGNDAKSTAACRLTISQDQVTKSQAAVDPFAVTLTAGAKVTTTIPQNGVPATPIPARSPIAPTDAAEKLVFPLQMVSTDRVVDLTQAGVNSSAGFAPKLTTTSIDAAGANTGGGGMVEVTLSCLAIPKS